MKKVLILTLVLPLFFLLGCGPTIRNGKSIVSTTGVIYGEDNRREITNDTPENYLKLARSVAGQISSNDLYQSSQGLKFSSSRINLCEGEKFQGQKTLPFCTGFLVGPDLLATAGHCVKSEVDCENSIWVFDYTIDSNQYKSNILNKNNVYKCKEVVATRQNSSDFALIRLDRKVIEREPLKFRTKGKIEDREEIMVIGHPSGLPMKIAEGGEVLGNYSSGSFNTNLDTFSGNSGSPVFNKSTGTVEGILVAGANDYQYGRNDCRIVVEFPNDRAEETVTRITQLSEIIKAQESSEDNSGPGQLRDAVDNFLKYAEEGNLSKVKLALSSERLDINMTDKDGNTPLYLAAYGEHTEIVKLLLAHPEIDENQGNNDGTTPLNLAATYGGSEVVELLLVHPGILVNKGDNYGITPLISASYKGHTRVAILLLAHSDIDVNKADSNGYTSLQAASKAGHTEIVKVLLAHPGFDGINLVTDNGDTSLILATYNDHTEVVRLLLSHPGIEVNLKDQKGKTALYYAYKNRNREIIKLLKSAGGRRR